MTTKKRIEANRKNAKKSTGPKTPEGKARSARNATKHGLLSSCPVLPEEDGEAYEQLRRNLERDLCPEGQLQQLLVNRIAAAQWRLARVPGLEAALFERLRLPVPGADAPHRTGPDAGLGAAWERDTGSYGGALGRLARYETMLERSTTRLLAELRRQQAHRLQLERRTLAEFRRSAGTRPADGIHQYDDPAAAWLEARGPAAGGTQPPTEAAFPGSEPGGRARSRGGSLPAPLPNPPHQVGRESVPRHLVEGDRAQHGGEEAAKRGAAPLPNEPNLLTVPSRAAALATVP